MQNIQRSNRTANGKIIYGPFADDFFAPIGTECICAHEKCSNIFTKKKVKQNCCSDKCSDDHYNSRRKSIIEKKQVEKTADEKLRKEFFSNLQQPNPGEMPELKLATENPTPQNVVEKNIPLQNKSVNSSVEPTFSPSKLEQTKIATNLEGLSKLGLPEEQQDIFELNYLLHLGIDLNFVDFFVPLYNTRQNDNSHYAIIGSYVIYRITTDSFLIYKKKQSRKSKTQ